MTARLKSLPGHFDANAGLRSQIQTPAANGFDSTSSKLWIKIKYSLTEIGLIILQFLVQQFDERSQVFRAKTANVNRVARQPSVSVYENTNVCLSYV